MTKIIKIGNSYGIRIPKPLIERANLKNAEIDLQIVENGLLLTPTPNRQNWDTQELRNKAKGIKGESDSKSDSKEDLQQDFLSEDLKDWEW